MKNIIVLTYWSYKDPLIQAYTLPYVKLISENIRSDECIYLVTLEKKALAITKDEASPIKDHLSSIKTKHIPLRYYSFGILSLCSWIFYLGYLLFIIRSKHIRFIHAWCTPAASLGFVLSKISGTPLIIDSYEPHAESMVETGTWQHNSFRFKILFWMEKMQGMHARILILCAEGMRNYTKEKFGFTPSIYFVKPACVDLDKFHLGVLKNKKLVFELGLENKIVCVYAGKFGGLYLEQAAFDFFKVAYDYYKNDFRVLLLTNHPDQALDYWAKQAKIPNGIIVKKFVSHQDIPYYMGLGDFAFSPIKSVPSKRYAAPIKNGEYWALGLPVVITAHIAEDSDMVQHYNIGAVLGGLNLEEYKKAIEKINELLLNNNDGSLTLLIRRLAIKHKNYSIANEIYKKIYLNR